MVLRRTVILVLFIFLCGLALTASAEQKAQVKAKLSPSEVEKIAKEAYISAGDDCLPCSQRHMRPHQSV